MGPFLGALLATMFYVILKQYVMTFSHHPTRTRVRRGARVVSSVSSFLPFFAFRGKGLDADAKKHFENSFSLHSFHYYTLNPGQEATEPKMSPPDPMRIIRAEGSSMDNSDEAV